MKKTQKYLVIIVLIALMAVFYFNRPAPTTPKEFQTVSFCGTNYEVEKVMLGEVNIIKRIAELATTKPESGVCRDVKSNFAFGNLTNLDSKNSNVDVYRLSFSSSFYILQLKQNKIFIEDSFTGNRTYLGPIK